MDCRHFEIEKLAEATGSSALVRLSSQMATILNFPESAAGISRRGRSLDAAHVDMQLTDLMSKLNRLKPTDSNHDLRVAMFFITVALSHAHTALQLISESSLRQQLGDKLDEMSRVLQFSTQNT